MRPPETFIVSAIHHVDYENSIRARGPTRYRETAFGSKQNNGGLRQ